MSTGYEDPFASYDKRPSVSFKDAPVGATVTMTVQEAPKVVQAKDFASGQPATWPDGNPKHNVVVNVLVNGVEMSLWVKKPSALFKALAAAQTAAGAPISPGGTLVVKYTGDNPPERPGFSPQKLYEATYTAPNAFAESGQEVQAWSPMAAQPTAPGVAAQATQPAAPSAPWL